MAWQYLVRFVKGPTSSVKEYVMTFFEDVIQVGDCLFVRTRGNLVCLAAEPGFETVWKYPLSLERQFDGYRFFYVAGNENALITADPADDNNYHIVAINPANGQLLWRKQVPSIAKDDRAAFVWKKNFLIINREQDLILICNLLNGETISTLYFSGKPFDQRQCGAWVYMTCRNSQEDTVDLYRVNMEAENPCVEKVADEVSSLFSANETMLFCYLYMAKSIRWFDSSSGWVRGEYAVELNGPVSLETAIAAYPHELLIWSDDDRKLQCVNIKSGHIRWTVPYLDNWTSLQATGSPHGWWISITFFKQEDPNTSTFFIDRLTGEIYEYPTAKSLGGRHWAAGNLVLRNERLGTFGLFKWVDEDDWSKGRMPLQERTL